MKTILVGINSKYIHTNLAIRYLKANCDLPVDTMEFTIKDNLDEIYNTIIKSNPDILGFSVYIWNIEIVFVLLEKIKQSNPNIVIILGGPEVSYEYDYFLTDFLATYVISNEGEEAFNLLINALASNSSVKDIPNVSYYTNNIIYRNKRLEIKDLNTLKNPYIFEDEDYKNKIQYVELSRGCPYNCTYCLASLEKNVRYFDLNSVKKTIRHLYNKGSKTFKFLDRTFNLKPAVAMELFQYVIENDFSRAVFQFEINGDILNDEILDYLNEYCPPNQIRFEIGIQSIHNEVNQSVLRNQDNDILFANIKKLKKGNVVLHLDLIAGLPFETFDLFKETFDTVFKLYGHELQLGFLKMLKGTKLYYDQKKYGYVIQEKAPYELVYNNYLSESDIKKIHIAEEMLEIYWNKNFMNDTLIKIAEQHNSPFEFFYNLGNVFLSKNMSFHRYQLSDVFSILESYLGASEYIYDLRKDYLDYNNIKPKIYWDNSVNKNEIIRLFHKNNSSYNINNLYKYSVVLTYKDGYLIVIYFPDNKEFHKIKTLI